MAARRCVVSRPTRTVLDGRAVAGRAAVDRLGGDPVGTGERLAGFAAVGHQDRAAVPGADDAVVGTAAGPALQRRRDPVIGSKHPAGDRATGRRVLRGGMVGAGTTDRPGDGRRRARRSPATCSCPTSGTGTSRRPTGPFSYSPVQDGDHSAVCSSPPWTPPGRSSPSAGSVCCTGSATLHRGVRRSPGGGPRGCRRARAEPDRRSVRAGPPAGRLPALPAPGRVLRRRPRHGPGMVGHPRSGRRRSRAGGSPPRERRRSCGFLTPSSVRWSSRRCWATRVPDDAMILPLREPGHRRCDRIDHARPQPVPGAGRRLPRVLPVGRPRGLHRAHRRAGLRGRSAAGPRS